MSRLRSTRPTVTALALDPDSGRGAVLPRLVVGLLVLAATGASAGLALDADRRLPVVVLVVAAGVLAAVSAAVHGRPRLLGSYLVP
ncbi:hypothetical protein, partial [Angustibacter aerolatus]